MAGKRVFSKGDIGHVRNNKRGKGFTIVADTPVKIIGYQKCDDKHGVYIYDIEVEHPRTKEVIKLDGWLTQFDLFTPQEWEKYMEKEKLIQKLLEQNKCT